MLTATSALKYRMLSGFYRFAVSRAYVHCSPLPPDLPKLPPQQAPYVYSTDELRRLLEATEILRTHYSKHVPAMYRTMLLLLYGTGMRVGEALRLTLQNIDLTERIISVLCGKFFKTRLVPIGPKLTDEPTAHIKHRGSLPMPHGNAPPLFTSRGIRGWTCPSVITLFQHVRRAASIECRLARHAPHAFMIFVIRRQSIELSLGIAPARSVQRLLPRLVTNLGHLDIRSTQRYLQMTRELLKAASQRLVQDEMLLGPWVWRFVLEHLVAERYLPPKTHAS